MASVEVLLPWGGDFAISSSGDLVLTQDGNGVYPALIQRVTQMLLTTPLISDGNGNPLSVPDDMFNPQTGVGLRWSVGRLADNAMLAKIETAILEGLAQEPDIAPYPVPTVEFVVYPNGVTCQVTATAVNGQVIAFPAIPVTPQGA